MQYLPEKYRRELDIGYQETDSLLFEMQAEIESVYGQAYNEMQAKSEDYLQWFRAEDEKKRSMLSKKLITADEYNTWRRTYVLIGRQNYALLEVLANDLSSTNAIATSIINGYMPHVYASNYNWTAFTIERDLKAVTSFSLFDEQTVERLIKKKPDLLPKASVNIPIDKRWNKIKLNSAITQGILQGETIDEIAVRLASVTDMTKNAAIRNAATMTTSAQNGGRMDSYRRAEDMGIKLQHRWIATLDGHTRSSHRMVDGDVIKVGDKFKNGLEYPGDPKGRPEEVYNCRCRTVAVVDGSQYDLSDRDFRRLNIWGMSYKQWKQAKGGEPMFKAARNVNRNLDMHEEYMDLLGKKIPSRFTDFEKVKYTQPDLWRTWVSDARKARNKKRMYHNGVSAKNKQ